MPLREWGPCPVCGRMTELVVFGEPSEEVNCEWCEEGVPVQLKHFSVIARPSTIHHMGKADPLLPGHVYTTERERAAHYDAMGIAHSSDTINAVGHLEQQAHEALEENKVVRRLHDIDPLTATPDQYDHIIKDSPKFQRLSKKLEGAGERSYKKAQQEVHDADAHS